MKPIARTLAASVMVLISGASNAFADIGSILCPRYALRRPFPRRFEFDSRDVDEIVMAFVYEV
jgi:hypothetical protein